MQSRWIATLALSAGLGQTATAQNPALSRYEAFMQRTAAAAALDFTCTGELVYEIGGEAHVFELAATVHVARLRLGRVVSTLTREGSSKPIRIGYVGNGEAVYSVDRNRGTYQDDGSLWNSLPPYLEATKAWETGTVPAAASVESATSPEYPGLAGLRCTFSGEHVETYWLTKEGALAAAELHRVEEQKTSRFQVRFSGWNSSADADPAAYLTDVPESLVRTDALARLTSSLLAPGTQAPDVELRQLDGTPLRLFALKGRTVVLVFWFNASRECRRELPRLDALRASVDESREDVVFLCVNFGDEPRTIERWWKEAGFGLLAVRQTGRAASDAFGVRSYPTTYVVDSAGRIIHRGIGYDEAALRGALKKTE